MLDYGSLAMSRRVWALAGAVLLLAAAVAGQGANSTSEEMQEMQEAYAQAVAAAGKPHLSYDVLPTERPLLDSMAQQGRWVHKDAGQPRLASLL